MLPRLPLWKRKEPIASVCDACGGQCCSSQGFNIRMADLPRDGRFADWIVGADLGGLLRASGAAPDMRFWEATHPVHGPILAFHCNHRTARGRCGIYDDRPTACRTYDCDALLGRASLAQVLADHKPVARPIREVTAPVQARLAAMAREPRGQEAS